MTLPDRPTQQASKQKHVLENPGCRSHAPPPPGATSSSLLTNKPAQASTTSLPPSVRTFFDPWNSSSTGHQRAENRLSGSTSWRDSRNLKLANQYSAGLGGGKRIADTVGAGSEGFGHDGRKENGGWEKGAKGLRTGGQKSLVETWATCKAGKTKDQGTDEQGSSESSSNLQLSDCNQDTCLHSQVSASETSETPPKKQIFAGLCFYVNGSTAPLVSDHKLKQLLAMSGARHSIALGRRTVTHVILSTASSNGGSGGGLAASKIQREIARTGGKAVKFITASWVLDSIKAERRLPESQYSPLKLAPKTQNSVFGMIRENSSQEKG
ncbi:hypothetical protein ACN47E_008596 [Coniothyrium glycines]